MAPLHRPANSAGLIVFRQPLRLLRRLLILSLVIVASLMLAKSSVSPGYQLAAAIVIAVFAAFEVTPHNPSYIRRQKHRMGRPSALSRFAEYVLPKKIHGHG